MGITVQEMLRLDALQSLRVISRFRWFGQDHQSGKCFGNAHNRSGAFGFGRRACADHLSQLER